VRPDARDVAPAQPRDAVLLVAGVPVEELLPLVPAAGAAAGLLLARARTLTARIARRGSRE
jgi:hypothetical protein